MIKAALEKEQASEVMKPKLENNSYNKTYKYKCYNCEGIGHLSRDCKKPKKDNTEIKKESEIKKEYSGSKTILICNYCRKPGHIIKDCRQLKYNNEKKK